MLMEYLISDLKTHFYYRSLLDSILGLLLFISTIFTIVKINHMDQMYSSVRC